MRSYADFNSREISQSTSNFDSKNTRAESKIQSVLEHIWNNLFNVLSGNSEVQIRQVRDRFSRSYWRVYDPITGYRNSFSSEAEARIWLEQRYSL
jgi:hypothetical protein